MRVVRSATKNGGLVGMCLRFIAVSFGIFATVSLISHLLDYGRVGDADIGVTTGRNMVKRIAFTRGFGGPRQDKVVLLGDSTLISCPKKRNMGYRLNELLNANKTRTTHVLHLATFGMSAFEYYPFADRIAEIRPGAVVFAFNLQSLSERWRDRFERTEMLGWLRGRRFADAIQEPLYWWQVTFDRLLLYTSLVHFDETEPWYRYRREQVRAGKGVTALRRTVQKQLSAVAGTPTATGLPPRPVPFAQNNPSRFRAEVLRALYGTALAGVTRQQPMLRMLAAVLDQFTAEHVPVIVYVTPMNWEYMRTVGLADRKGLLVTLKTIKSIVSERRGYFVDLHALLPDEGFADPGGHFICSGRYDGPLIVAKRLLPSVTEALTSNPEKASALQ